MCKTISLQQTKQILDSIDRALMGWCYDSGDKSELMNAIRVKFNVRHISELPAEDFTAIVSFINELSERSYILLGILAEFKHYALREVVMGGAPFTQVVINNYKKQFDSIPKAINWVEMVGELQQAKQRALIVGAEV